MADILCQFCLIFLLSFVTYVNSDDLYSSIDGLELLIESERKFLDSLNVYLDAETERLENLETLQNRRKAMIQSHKDNSRNAVQAFRYLNTFFDLEEKILNTQEKPAVRNYNTYAADAKKIFCSRSEDMEGAAVALLRVQDTYKIDAEEMHDDMTADDCFYLGHVSLEKAKYDAAIPWLMLAEEKMPNENGTVVESRQFNATMLYDYLAYAFREQKNYEWALWYMRLLHETSPEYPAKVHLDYYNEILEEEGSEWDGQRETLPDIKIMRNDQEFPEYEALCRGENQNTTWLGSSELYCFYKRNTPFLKLAPIKVELLHRKPDVFLFPEALADYETDTLLDVASPELNRALVINSEWKNASEEKQHIKSTYRTSKIMSIDDEEYEISEIVSKRVAAMTDLNMEPESTEKLQIANYGIGGHYSPHFDMATSPEDMDSRNHMFGESGNRIATMLFYLSDPKGGATVFDDIGVTVFAKKASNTAILWYNLYRNGEPDLLTHHGGCPVLYGQKWIANKWLHERGNEFLRPCTLNPNE